MDGHKRFENSKTRVQYKHRERVNFEVLKSNNDDFLRSRQWNRVLSLKLWQVICAVIFWAVACICLVAAKQMADFANRMALLLEVAIAFKYAPSGLPRVISKISVLSVTHAINAVRLKHFGSQVIQPYDSLFDIIWTREYLSNLHITIQLWQVLRSREITRYTESPSHWCSRPVKRPGTR